MAKIKKIYLGTTLVRPYIEYKPTSNTLCYLPMRADTATTDYGSLNWTWTVGGTAGSYFKDNYWHGLTGDYLGTGYNTFSSYTAYTCLIWMRCQSTENFFLSETNYGSGDNGNFTFEINKINRYNGSNRTINFSKSYNDGQWHMFVLTGQSGIAYVDGVQVGTNSSNVQMKPRAVTVNAMRLNTGDQFEGDYSDLIIENKVRTATEILNHYNKYKSNYGL